MIDAEKILKETEALLHGHFLLSSGLHSDMYIQCAKMLQYPWHAQKFGEAIANALKEFEPDCIVSPAVGGIIIGHETAKSLKVPFLFTERDDEGTMIFRRGFDPSGFKRIAVVEDVVTTGKSTSETVAAIKRAGAVAVAAAAIANRGGLETVEGLPFIALINLPLKKYEASECPMCKAGDPAVKPGTRKIFK